MRLPVLRFIFVFQLTAARRRLAGGVRHVAGGGAFQLTAARRRLGPALYAASLTYVVSTHSRPKAAGYSPSLLMPTRDSFNSQPPEGGWFDLFVVKRTGSVSTHSRPKAAGFGWWFGWWFWWCFNSQPPEGGWIGCMKPGDLLEVSTHSRPKAAGYRLARPFSYTLQFQLTAARRRLALS